MEMAQRSGRGLSDGRSSMIGWLDAVQRDPRTLGAFRRRIESLLRDPAVARRVASRLERLKEEGRASPPERDPALAAGLAGRILPLGVAGGGCAVAARRSLFGSCDCSAGCCLMLPDLRPIPALGPMRALPRDPEPLRH